MFETLIDCAVALMMQDEDLTSYEAMKLAHSIFNGILQHELN